MTKENLSYEIRQSWAYAKALGVSEVFSEPVALSASEKFKRLSTNTTVTYEELYSVGLSENQYNILLKDFSFFQYGFGKVDGVRFAYYPNPFLGASSDAISELSEMREYVEEGIIDMDEFLHKASELRRSQHPPLVRYEYSKSQYHEQSHPCSHMHLGFHGENRWPIKRALTANAFSLMVLRLFYMEFWIKADPIRVGEENLSLDEIFSRERRRCRILSEEEFSSREDGRFHFW